MPGEFLQVSADMCQWSPGQKVLRAAEVRYCQATLCKADWTAMTGVGGRLRGYEDKGSVPDK